MNKGTRVINRISGTYAIISSDGEKYSETNRYGACYGVRLDNGDYRKWACQNVERV